MIKPLTGSMSWSKKSPCLFTSSREYENARFSSPMGHAQASYMRRSRSWPKASVDLVNGILMGAPSWKFSPVINPKCSVIWSNWKFLVTFLRCLSQSWCSLLHLPEKREK